MNPTFSELMNEKPGILIQGRNCWRKPIASRVSFLIDGAAYFEAFKNTAERAEQSIYIAGWDIDSRVALVRSEESSSYSHRIGDFLNHLAVRTPALEINILAWDFAMLFALERQPFPYLNLGWGTHERVRFKLDDQHPLGASHHQKIVVVDDKIAFVGGLDLAKHRWDTVEHKPKDVRRLDPNGKPYAPFHDVQMMIEGEAAQALGDLFRERWARATGRELNIPEVNGHNPWPCGLEADLKHVPLAIARTLPEYKNWQEVREIENLYLDAIAAARHAVYIENQYLTSNKVGEAMAIRLAEPEGPEIVMVLPHKCTGWLEESTMDGLRARLVARLREADSHGRLRLYSPVVTGGDDPHLFVHSKVLIVDDTLVRVGSSNLSNRSMGLDTECDVALEARGDPEIERVIGFLRDRLLGEHLGIESERVRHAYERHDSLVETVELLRGSGRTLEPLEIKTTPWLDAVLPDAEIIDPERPNELERAMDEFDEDEAKSSKKHLFRRLVFIALVLAGFAAAWRWSPLAQWLDWATIGDWARSLQSSPFAPLVVVLAYILGGVTVCPASILIGTTAIVFEPLYSIGYSLLGCLSNAAVTYGIGHRLGSAMVRKVAGSRINRLSKRLAKNGLVTVVIIRFLPVAPYTVVNMAAGASHIRFRDFMLGTALGMAPGIVSISILADRLEAVLKDPKIENFVILAGMIVLVILASVWIQRRLKAEHVGGQGEAPGGQT